MTMHLEYMVPLGWFLLMAGFKKIKKIQVVTIIQSVSEPSVDMGTLIVCPPTPPQIQSVSKLQSVSQSVTFSQTVSYSQSVITFSQPVS